MRLSWFHRTACIAALPGLLGGCATTTHDARPAEPLWHAAEPAPQAPATGGEPLAVYVAAFGLRPEVAVRWPQLAEARVGLGLANRIAEALYATRSFRLLEEKAEVVARLAAQLANQAEDATPPREPPAEAPWLLYGEVVEVLTRRSERVVGLAGKSEITTTVAVELRLVERGSRRTWVATGSGSEVREGSRGRGEGAADLDPVAVAAATQAAVAQAGNALTEHLLAEQPGGR